MTAGLLNVFFFLPNVFIWTLNKLLKLIPACLEGDCILTLKSWRMLYRIKSLHSSNNIFTCSIILPLRLMIISQYCIYCLMILNGTRCVSFFAVRSGKLYLYIHIVTLLFREVLSCRPLTVEIRVRSHDSPYEICYGHSGTVTGFSPSTPAVCPLSVIIHQCSIPIFILTI